MWWELADHVRRLYPGATDVALLRSAVDRGLVGSWRDVSRFAQENRRTVEYVDPALIADFLLAFTEGVPPLRVLDPWAGLGISLAALEQAGRVSSGVAIEINAEVDDVSRHLWPGSGIERRLGDAAMVLADGLGSFDLVAGYPPIGMPQAILRTQHPAIDLRASKTYTMLVQAAMTVAPQGTLIVVLPESFFGPRAARVRDALAAASMFPSASFALPLRSFATSIALSLVVFTHEVCDNLFVAELDPSGDLASVVHNYRARLAGRLPQLGMLVPPQSFVSWRATLLAVDIAALAQRSGLRRVALREICTAMRAAQREEPEFNVSPNAVYLPKLGISPAVTTLDAPAIKPHNYLQLLVQPERADPEYLAAFFNSPLGRRVREHLATGTTIPKLSLQTLGTADVYLPELIQQQRAAVGVGRTLSELRQSVTSLERELWERPLRAVHVEQELHALLEGDGLERWMESLPFPLASILWRSRAVQEPERRCRHLVHFFEAVTVFLADLHLSALRRDPKTWAAIGAHPSAGGSAIYTHGSIGIWGDLLARLARQTRGLLERERPLALELFQVTEPDRILAISRTSVVAALKEEAAQFRRDWIAHSVEVSREDWDRRLEQAEATLGRVREGIADAFADWQLVLAGAGRNHAGVIATSIKVPSGTRSDFREDVVELRELPEDGGLYLLESGASLMLRLGPLLRMGRSPNAVDDACYFYDRLQADAGPDGVRWVSYHYEPQPEVVLPDRAAVELIGELNALG
jgi:hypothetical protein